MKKLFTLLIALFSFLSMSLGQIYSENFNAGSVNGSGVYTSGVGQPTLANVTLNANWSGAVNNTATSPPPTCVVSEMPLRNNLIPSSGSNTFTLVLNVASGKSLNITGMTFKDRSSFGGNGSVQVKVNGTNFGSSFTVPSATCPVSESLTSSSFSCLSGTVTITLVVSKTNSGVGSYVFDDFTINGTATTYSLFNITGASKTICNADPASSNQAFGLSGSELGSSYELLRDGNPISPAVVLAGTGSALAFGTFRAAGIYTVVKKCNSNIPMTGSFTLNNVANPTGMVWSVADLVPICNGLSKPIAVTVTGGTPPYVISYNAGVTPQNFPSYTNGLGSISVSPPATTIYSGASVIDANGCAVDPGSGLPTNSITVSVNARPTGVLSGGNTNVTRVCSGATSTLSIAVTGTGPWSGTLSDETLTPIPFSGTVSPITVNVSPATTKSYAIATLVDANACATTVLDLTGIPTVFVDNTTPSVSGATNQTANTTTACTAALSVPISVTDACATTYNWSATGATSIAASVPVSTTGTIASGGGTFNVAGTFNKGTTIINWSVTDGANQTTGSFTIIVSDNVAPVPTCPVNPGPLALAPDPSQSYATVTSLAFTATDNCAVTTGSVVLTGATSTLTNAPTITLSGASLTLTGQQFSIGSTLVTYTVSDAAGNTAPCSFTVNVTNNQAPLFLPCLTAQTGTTDASACTFTPTTPYSTTIQDNAIGSVSMTYALSGATTLAATTVTPGAISGNQRLFTLPSIAFGKGVTTVTLTATGSSNTICSFTVTVTDDDAPTITCPASSTVNTSTTTCTYTLPATTITFGDNCSPVVLSASPNVSVSLAGNTISGTLQKGVNTISLTATDDAGNTNFTPCSYTITVNDATAPTITCPGSQTVQTGPGATTCNKLVTGLLASASDNCGPITLSRAISPASLAPAPAFLNGNGNDASGTYAVGTTSITFTAMDAGVPINSTPCTFSITVIDNTPPTIAAGCPTANITVNPDVSPNNPSASLCDATRTYSITPSDNCTPTTGWMITGVTTASGLGATTGAINFQPGVSTVKFTVTDVASATATCQFTVTVSDNVAPTFTTCTPSVSVNTTAGCTGTATIPVSATDLCSSPTITYLLSGVTTTTVPTTVSGSSLTRSFNVGPTIVTFTATDGTNTSTCQTVVTVTDNQPPTIACPSNTTVNTLSTATTCDVSLNFASNLASASDNCAIASTTFSKVSASGTTSGTGLNATGTYPVSPTVSSVVIPTVVTFTTTDVAGLTGTCSFRVTVIDATNPIVTCPANIVTSTGINVCTKTVSFAPSLSSDNCAVVSTSWSASGASLGSGTTASGMALFPGGTTPVTFTVRDAQNNSGQCTFNVIVNDNEAPVITAINDVTINSSLGSTIDCAAPLSISASVTDNCGITLATGVTWTAPGATPASGTGNGATNVIFPVGTTTVTYTATDNTTNNTSIETFNVVVVDNQAPIITGCPSTPLIPITANMDNGVCFTNRSFSVTASDNCSSSLVTSWSVTNGAATLGSGSGLAINALQFPAGNNIVTFTVSDGLTVPNTSTCQFTFQVNDNQLPVIAAIADVTINSSLAPTTDCAAPLSISASATDNCLITAITYSWIAPGATPASGTDNSLTSVLFPVGTTTVTYTATDAAGNTDTEVFTVTVTDDQAPVVTGCPTIPVALGTDNTNLSAPCTASYSFTPTVMDNCTPTSVPLTQTQQAPPPTLVTYSWSITNSAALFSATGTSATISSLVLPSGTNTVVFTATDAVGNTSSSTACSFTVVVTDDDKPAVTTCPTASSITLATGTCVQSYTATPPVSDNCTAQLTYAWTVSNGSTLIATGTSAMVSASLPIGVNTVAYTATDAANNTSLPCNYTVTIFDVQAPTIACPLSSMVNVDATSCINTYTNTPVVTDNCGTPTYLWTIKDASMVTLFSGTTNAISGTLPVGVNTVSFTATDASGNTSTACSYTVTVKDDIAPTFTCPANVTVGTDQGLCTASQSFAITATDNCPSNTVTYLWSATQVPTTVSSGMTATVSGLFPTGTTNVSFIAQDNASTPNTRSCNFTVTVLDDEAPTFTAPANIVSAPTNFTGCKWRGTLGTPTNGNDNCGSVIYSWSVPSGTMGIMPLTGGVGTTVTIDNGVSVAVTWVASDNAMPANTTLPQTQTVSVQTTLALSSVTLADNSGISTTDGIVCQNGSVTLTANATGGTTTYAYAWSPIIPAVSNGVAFTPTAATGVYVVTVTDMDGCTVTSSGIPKTVVVKPTPTVTVGSTVPGFSSTNRIIICENAGNLVLTFATTGMSASGNTYKVISTGAGTSLGLSSLVGVTGFFAGGAPSVSIPLPTTIATGLQFITLSFTSGDGCNTVGSQTFYINVNPGANASLAGTGFLNPTPTRIICDATPAQVVRVNFTGTAPFSLIYSDGTTSYSVTNINSSATPGQDFYDITSSATTPGVYTIVACSDALGCSGNTLAGRSITIVDRRITISAQPQSVSVCSNTSATFSVTATAGASISYQWWSRPSAGAQGTIVLGNVSANTSMLTIPAAQVATTPSGTEYYCILTNNAGGCADVSTANATITVGAAITGVTAGADATAGSSPYSLSGSIGTGTSGIWTVVPANASVSFSPSSSSPTATVSGLPPGATTLRLTVTNGVCTVSDDVVLTRTVPKINLFIALEGSFDPSTGLMAAKLIANPGLPVVIKPGAATYFNGVPNSVLLIPTTEDEAIVDLVDVELRAIPTGPAVLSRTGIVRRDGKVVELSDGQTSLSFDVPVTVNYYVVVKHRNHLGFRSASAIDISPTVSGNVLVNFAVGQTAAFTLGTIPGLKPIGIFQCAYSGNGNADNRVNNADFLLFLSQNGTSGINISADYNLDGRVNNSDFILYLSNNGRSAQF
jgi:HYR domain